MNRFLKIFIIVVTIGSGCENHEVANLEESTEELSRTIEIFADDNINSVTINVTFPNLESKKAFDFEKLSLNVNPKMNNSIVEEDIDYPVDALIDSETEPIIISITAVNFTGNVKEYEIVNGNSLTRDSKEDGSQLRGCKYLDYYLYENQYAYGVKTRNRTSKLCNDYRVFVWKSEYYASANLNGLINTYTSTKKHGLAYTYREDGSLGLTVELHYMKRSEWDLTWLY